MARVPIKAPLLGANLKQWLYVARATESTPLVQALDLLAMDPSIENVQIAANIARALEQIMSLNAAKQLDHIATQLEMCVHAVSKPFSTRH